jgi:murein DD-endopeptidase MepM/ murein hydrolase activator NlpD
MLLLAAAACGCGAPESPVSIVRGDIALASDSEMVPARVPPGATLGAMLQQHALHAPDLEGLLRAITAVFEPRRLRTGQAYRLERTATGCVRLFEYEVDPERVLRVRGRAADPHVFDADIIEYESTTRAQVVNAIIAPETPSLFGAMEAAGARPELPIALADIFGGEVDFRVDLQQDDAFAVLVDETVRDGRFVKYGPVQAAIIEAGGRPITAVRFTPPSGKTGYYDENGRSLQRFFLRSPLRFQPHVTSGFSRARLHPVLHVVRAHLGVDYRAPHGAPVIAVAHGTVTGAGWRGGGGRTVSIRHANGYESFYLHLSSIAPGVRRGARITQGQVIGRVGATGVATGPHLDYRLRKGGVFVNPLLEHRKMPPGDPVPPDALDAFMEVRDAALARLQRAEPEIQLTAQH